jgi:PAS domain S-box-containing protein
MPMLETKSASPREAVRDHEARARLEREIGELQNQLRQQTELAEFAIQTPSIRDRQTLLTQAAGLVAQELAVQVGMVWEALPDLGSLALRGVVGLSEGRHESIISATLDIRGVSSAFLSIEPLILESIPEDSLPNGHFFRRHEIGSLASVLIPGMQRPYGILAVAATSPHAFSAEAIRFMTGVARTLAGALEQLDRLEKGENTERLLRLLWDQCNDGLRLIDTRGTIQWVNEAYCRIVEKPKAALEGKPLSVVHAPDTQAEVLDAFLHQCNSRTLQQPLDAAVTLWNGKTVRLEMANRFVDGENGSGQVLSVTRDVSDRRRAQEERQHLLRERSQLTDHLGLLLEATADGVLGLDVRGCCTFVNRAAATMLGFTPGGLVGQNIHEMIHPTAADGTAVPEVDCPLCAALQSGQRSQLEDVALRRRDGSRFQAQYSCHPIVQNGSLRGGVVTFSDTTERLRLEQQLRHSQKMEAVGQLAGGIAHDFNNLLTVIIGYSELLLTTLDEQNPSRNSAEQILKAAERSAALTRQLLAFSRKQVGSVRLLNLDPILVAMRDLLMRLIGEQVELHLKPGAAEGLIAADAGQIQQVVMNLAINARDAMPTGGRLTIESANVVLNDADCRRLDLTPGSYVALTVSDTGSGMTEEVRNHLFEPFFTTKEPGKGTGLGLSTVYGIVKQAHGDIVVHSEPNQGACFRMYLPRVSQALAARPAVQPNHEQHRNRTILVVEDEDTVRCLVRMILRWNGYQVLESRHPEEALVRANQHVGTIDLLLTDVILPHLSGPELAKQLMQSRPEMKVLYMSGHTGEALEQVGMSGPSSSFLAKPFTPDALSTRLAEIFAN